MFRTANLPWVIPIRADTSAVALAFHQIMQCLRFAIGQAQPVAPSSKLWLALLSARVARLSVWLANLARRAEAGRATPRRRPTRPTDRPAEPPGEAPPNPPRGPRPRWPDNPAWLSRLVPEAARFRAELTELLNRPETAALLEQAPHAAGRLRPLCRALGVDPDQVACIDLRRRRRVRPPRPKPSESERVRRRLSRQAPPPPLPPPPPDTPPPAPPARPTTLPRLGWAGIIALRGGT